MDFRSLYQFFGSLSIVGVPLKLLADIFKCQGNLLKEITLVYDDLCIRKKSHGKIFVCKPHITYKKTSL